MLSKTMQDALNEQIKNEFYSSYLYLAMAAHADSINLPGFSQWLRFQAWEEVAHAMKMYYFVLERGGNVELRAVDAPPTEWESPFRIFADTLGHEQKVTAMIHDIYSLAAEERDIASQIFLQWFVTEQVEEESNADRILRTLKRIGDSNDALIQLDRELGQRRLGVAPWMTGGEEE